MNFITAYPELDGIVTVFTGNGMGEAILATLNAYNKAGSVKVAGFDLFNTVQTAFKTNTFHSLAGGHYVDPLFSLVILYNYLARTPLSDKPVEINLSFMYFNSIEDIDNFFKYCQGEEFPYNSEEIKQMIKLYNPEMTVDKLKKIASQYSIEDVIARHVK